MPAGTSQDATLAEAATLEQVVQNIAPVDLIQTQTGGEGLIAAFTDASSSRASMTVTLDHSANLNDVMDQMRVNLASSADPGTEITASNMSGGFGGSSNQVSVIVRGNDYQQVSDVTGQFTEQIAGVNNLVNVKNDVVTSKPEVAVQVDSAKAAAAGVTAQQVAADFTCALNGVPGGSVAIDGTSSTPVRPPIPRPSARCRSGRTRHRSQKSQRSRTETDPCKLSASRVTAPRRSPAASPLMKRAR